MCEAGCLKCTSKALCTSCLPGYYLSENSCLTECNSIGEYEDSSSNTCESCDSNCYACFGATSTQCTLCIGSNYYYVVT